MELYIGGLHQGKLSYVLTKKKLDYDNQKICNGENCSVEETFSKPILNHFHVLIRRLLVDNQDISLFLTELLQRNPDIYIICNEVGYGLVPLEKEEREYREVVGRSCCELAACAKSVERIICGIGVKIK